MKLSKNSALQLLCLKIIQWANLNSDLVRIKRSTVYPEFKEGKRLSSNVFDPSTTLFYWMGHDPEMFQLKSPRLNTPTHLDVSCFVLSKIEIWFLQRCAKRGGQIEGQLLNPCQGSEETESSLSLTYWISKALRLLVSSFSSFHLPSSTDFTIYRQITKERKG